MGRYTPAPGISDKARAIFDVLAQSGSSEAYGVLDTLNTIAENGDGQETDEQLRVCAEEMRDYAQAVLDALRPVPPEPPVAAEAHSDDHAVEVAFNAALWLQQATPGEIQDLAECGWGGDYPADAVAEWTAEYNDELARLFSYLETVAEQRDAPGFECHVDEAQARDWLRQHRPDALPPRAEAEE